VGAAQSPLWRQPGTQPKSFQTSPAVHWTSSVEQAPAGMQTPLAESQMESEAQSAVESQRSRDWQKPAALHISAAPQLESPLQRHAPVVGSQAKPLLHCVSLEQRLCAPFLHEAHNKSAARRRRAVMGW